MRLRSIHSLTSLVAAFEFRPPFMILPLKSKTALFPCYSAWKFGHGLSFPRLIANIIFYAATVFSGILSKSMEEIIGETGFWQGLTSLGSLVMWPIPVLCSHCIKMGICYSRTLMNSSSEASTFPKNEFPFFFVGLVVSANFTPHHNLGFYAKMGDYFAL